MEFNVGRDEGTRGDRILLGRIVACIDLLGRSGVKQVELAYDNDDSEHPDWWAGGVWKGARKFTKGKYPYPTPAIEELAHSVVNGGHCPHCGKTTILGMEVAGYCCFVLEADDVDDTNSYRYVQTCKLDG
jgi:hypothetical protein